MKTDALVLVKAGKVDITQVDVPDPGPGELLIEVKANGICRGDIALFTGELNYGYPFFHGHEPVGIVARPGAGVSGFAPGDRVAVLGSPSYRRHIVVHSSQAIKIPDQPQDLALWIAEPPACAVHGAHASGLRPADKVALLGCGYMGLLVLQSLPRETLARLVVADPDPTRLALARSFGAEEAYDPAQTHLSDIAKSIGGFDVVIEAAGVKGTLSAATDLLRVGGTLNIFGWHPGEESIPAGKWHYLGLKVLNPSPMFSENFSAYFPMAVALMAKGRIDQSRLITHRFPMEQADEAFALAAGKKDGYIKGALLF